ncbi:MAG: GNAT family N-acetyltransferase [Candidatus Thorarchaeota archaeon]|jgi:ribosomal protein S18 acetylase RimI-like enzyme
MMMSKIRDYQDVDAESIATISGEAFTDEIERGMNRFTPEWCQNMSQRKGTKIFVAEENSNFIGYLILTEANVEVPAQIHLMAVEEESRGKGVGKRLVKTAVEYVKGSGGRKVRLYTRPWNVGMSKVCVELGFIPEAYLRKEYLGEDLVQYSFFLE